MTRANLEKLVFGGRNMIREFYERRLFVEPEYDVALMWATFSLKNGDWTSLTKLLLGKTFSDELLTPLEDIDDAGFRMEIKEHSLGKFTSHLYSGYEADAMVVPRVVVAVPRYDDVELGLQRFYVNEVAPFGETGERRTWLDRIFVIPRTLYAAAVMVKKGVVG